MRMSLTLASFSSGSIGPRPVISSRISLTKPASSWALSARRSTRMYCETSCWTCLRISSSGSFSNAERLISSISLRCSRTLASSSFSVSSGLADCGAAGSGAGSGVGRVANAGASATTVSSTAGASGGAATRWVEKRPIMPTSYGGFSAARGGALRTRPRQFEFLLGAGGVLRGSGLALRQDDLLELQRDLVALLDLFERYAAVDRLAHQRIVVGNAGEVRVADRLLDIAAPQAGRKHFLHVAIDDDARLDALEPLANGFDQLFGLTQARHRGLADDEQFVGAEQHAVGPGEPGARHVEHHVVEMRRHEIEQPRDDVGIKRAHLRRPVRRGDHRKPGRMLRQHDFEQLAVEPLGARLDFVEVEPRLDVEIVGA